MNGKVQIQQLENHGDRRGFSFDLPAEALAFVGRVADLHVADVRPGTVRGNHFHNVRREALLVSYKTECSLHWDEGERLPAQHRQFRGTGAVLMLIEPGASHALCNDGHGELVIVAVSSEPYNPHDSIPRIVT